MNLGMFAVMDGKARAFISPFCLPTDGMAVRVFSDCVNDPAHMFGKHPEDFGLYKMGEFDPERGLIAADPVLLVNALSCKEAV